MIKDGDFFTVADLKKSVAQATGVDVQKYLKNRLVLNPDSYAEQNIQLYADIKSSALALDKQLKDSGFRTKYKFSYDYNIPGLSYDEIVRDAYKLEFFYSLAVGDTKKKVKPESKKALVNAFFDAARVSYYYAQYIWATNPSSRFDYSQRFNPQRDWGFVISFLLGVGFRFHPKDVYEFVVNHNNPYLNQAQRDGLYAKQLDFKNWCMDTHKIDTGCLVLCAEHQEKLRKILNRTDTPYFVQQVQALSKQIKAISERIMFGRLH